MTVTLPPLSDLFAFSDPDPQVLDAVEATLVRVGRFHEVWRPTTDWVAAKAPLPYSVGDGPEVRDAGLAFVEGRDRVVPGRGGHEARQVAELALGHPERLGRLPGDIGLLAFGPGGSAVAVRSCGGLAPLHVYCNRSRRAVATRTGDLARYLPEPPGIDPLTWAAWATGTGVFPYNRSFLQHTLVVPRGHAAVLAPGRVPRLVRYFDPRPDRWPHRSQEADEEHVTRLRSVLVDTLASELHPDGGNLLTLSGGVDSSSLGALAARVARRPVWSLSLLAPEGDPERSRELQFIEGLAGYAGITRRWNADLDLPSCLERVGQAPPVPIPVVHPALCLLRGIADEAGVRVLFGGELADEICGGPAVLPDWLTATSLWQLARSRGRLPTGRRDIARWAAWRLAFAAGRPKLPVGAEAPSFVAEPVRAEYRQWRADLRRAASRGPTPWRYLELRTSLDGWVAMNWEVTSALGIRRCIPFLTRATLELAFSCHPSEMLGPGTKRLLRVALADDVPTANLGRPDKGRGADWAGNQPVPVTGSLPPQLDSLLAPAVREPGATLPMIEAFLLAVAVRGAELLPVRPLRQTPA